MWGALALLLVPTLVGAEDFKFPEHSVEILPKGFKVRHFFAELSYFQQIFEVNFVFSLLTLYAKIQRCAGHNLDSENLVF